MADPIEIDTLLGSDWEFRSLGGQTMLVTASGGSKVVLSWCAHRKCMVTRGPAGTLIALDDDSALGRLLCAIPALVEAARMVRDIRPANYEDGDDPEQTEAWQTLDAAFAAAGIEPSIREGRDHA